MKICYETGRNVETKKNVCYKNIKTNFVNFQQQKTLKKSVPVS